MSVEPRQDRPADAEPVDPAEIIRIVDDEIDVDAIMAEIRSNLASRPRLDPDPSGLIYSPGDAAQGELEWLLEQAGVVQQSMVIGDQLRAGPGVVGTAVAAVKRPLHQLARFYVELFARKQSELDGHLLRALGILSGHATTSREEIAALRREVADLRRQLAESRGDAGATEA